MWEQIRANKRKSLMLVVAMALVLFLLGYAGGELLAPGGGRTGLVMAMVIWIIMSVISYFQGRNIFLAVSGAKKIERNDYPRLYNIVEEMQIAAGLSRMPDIYIIDDSSPNAFATGRDADHAAVAVTSGLLQRLNRDELQGVIAHEMSHIKNYDVLIMILAGVLMGSIVLLADIIVRSMFWGGMRRSRRRSNGGGQGELILIIVGVVLMILAPIIAQLIYFAVSRKREYLADASAAQLTRYPEGLASALEKIAVTPHVLKSATRATAPMYIINPLRRPGQAVANLTSTHPPISERIGILRSMAGGAGYVDYEGAYRNVHGGGKGVLPASVLKQEDSRSTRKPILDKEASDAQKRKEVNDLLWRLNKYLVVPCACGLTIKIPPSFKSPRFQCPRCGSKHTVETVKAEASLP